jgi:hypothetical protein
MSASLINRSADLKQLRDEGFNIAVVGGYLLIRDIPYVTADRRVKRGTLVSKLDLAGDVTIRPQDHTMKWIGEMPCHAADGSPMNELVNESQVRELDAGITIQHSFSHKPKDGYTNFYDKVTTYVFILCTQAHQIDNSANPRTFRVEEPEDYSPFRYVDTASSRAEITAITRKLALHKVGIVGVGGTGSYILDLIAKVPIREIHLFDGDRYASHNAFRSPGAATLEELRGQPFKVAYFAAKYQQMHRGIHPHECYITPKNLELLREMSFVFLAIDKPDVLRPIIDQLDAWGIPYIIVGMAADAKNGAIGAQVNVTMASGPQREHVRKRVSLGAVQDDEYDTNVQIADLNALNAAFAVIRWKKLFSFYHDFEREQFSSYAVDTHQLTSDDQLESR